MNGQPGDPDLVACRTVFEWLDAEGGRVRALPPPQKAGVADTYSDLILALAPAPQAALRAAFDTAQSSGDLHPYWVHGPRGYGEDPAVLPALTFRWDRTPQGLNVQVMVVLAVAGSRSTDKVGLRGSALRFESGAPGTTHDFDHVQQSVSMVQGGSPILSGLHLPPSTTTPAVPLDSTGPAGLLLCAVRAVYGTTRWQNMLSRDPSLATAVRPFLVQMPAFASRLAAPPRALSSPPTPVAGRGSVQSPLPSKAAPRPGPPLPPSPGPVT